MKLPRILCLIGLSLILIIADNGAASQLIDGPIAHEHYKRSIQKMLYQEKFVELEKLAHELRSKKEKFPDGIWKLLIFYEGFESPLDNTPEGWKRFLTKFDKWLQARPTSTTAKVAAGTAWAFWGWEARGHGYAYTVTDGGWRVFHERLGQALALLAEKPVPPEEECPGRYDLLLTIANAQGWDRTQYERLFREAVTFEPTYHAFFLNKANYLTQKWHGQKGDWQNFTQNTTESIPTKEAEVIYARIITSFWPNEFKSFANAGVDWAGVKKGFAKIEQDYPGSPWNLNRFCQLACVAKDAETARKLFARIGNHPYWQAWKNDEYEKCQDLIGSKNPRELKFNPWLDTEDFHQLLQLAEEGDANAQYQIGLQYYGCATAIYCSTNVQATFREAIKWFEKAAEQDHVGAQLYLATLYTSGMGGIIPNYEKAIKLNESAAYQGSSGAAFFLAKDYFAGQTVKQDFVKAFVWFSQMTQPDPLREEAAAKLTPEQLKEAELEIKKIRSQILKNKEAAETK